uniref:Uncharacterized protein n=1 Tax=Biddulphia biddulphiana TaxID=1158022 RepID=A0A2U9NSN6_9STRA|nr:hypothetical protein ycf3 [Biddulphia biddulphiana]AWT40062.1 hypothetical protein ycf3 [Biddulphia biddulphiana]
MLMTNFIDKAFSVLADVILKILPASLKEKKSFSYYRKGMVLQSKNRFKDALISYYAALEIEEDPYDRSFILYNIGLIFETFENDEIALQFFLQGLVCNPNLSQSLNSIGALYHRQARLCEREADEWLFNNQETNQKYLDRDEYDFFIELSKELYEQAALYFRAALRQAPDSYPEARNWLISTGRDPNEPILELPLMLNLNDFQ